jgi:hypothetical protein
MPRMYACESAMATPAIFKADVPDPFANASLPGADATAAVQGSGPSTLPGRESIMRVTTSRTFRLLAGLFAALALAFGGAGVASATSTSNPVSSGYCDYYWDGRYYVYWCHDNNGNRDFRDNRDNGNRDFRDNRFNDNRFNDNGVRIILTIQG